MVGLNVSEIISPTQNNPYIRGLYAYFHPKMEILRMFVSLHERFIRNPRMIKFQYLKFSHDIELFNKLYS